MGRAGIARVSASRAGTLKNVNAIVRCNEGRIHFMTARDFIEFYQRYCEERGWELTRAEWMQLDVIARGMDELEYRKFRNSEEGAWFGEILERLDDCDGVILQLSA